MAERKARIGFVGCGGHATSALYPTLHRIPQIELVAVCDLKEELAKRNARLFGALRWYTDVREMLEKEDLDGVIIVGPPQMHVEVGKICLDAGKPIFVEKPSAISYEEALSLARYAEERRLFLVPYHTFQLALLTSKVPPKLELVLFRRFMVKVANRIAKDYGLQAIVTGDNLSQVASQTLENLSVLDNASDLPIFRPLLTYDKQEIIALARQIGTYELSIQPYKDCCSLIARHPETRAKLREVLEAESVLPIEQLISRSLSEMSIITVGDQSVEGPSKAVVGSAEE
jgi:hypothetical protein